ncbi:hypothetical protein MRB53_022344 [Persea americana]|uniref:Uncharacterized protein n=1 Tax=Persea americana TaxID=3435 RepID=A0ACC2L682_PERAE|nr:hypothetical protein MRB53_022344 [Persea americana]
MGGTSGGAQANYVQRQGFHLNGKAQHGPEISEENRIGERRLLLLEANREENSPLGWWNFKYIPKEEKDTVIYERVNYPYPGDKEAMDAFIASGGLRGTAIGPQGFFDPREDSENYHKEWQKKRYEQEAKKLWFRMKNEVISELQEKGFDNE